MNTYGEAMKVADRKPGPLETAVERLAKQVSVLRETVRKLKTRLVPVLLLSPEKNQGGLEGPTPVTPAAPVTNAVLRALCEIEEADGDLRLLSEELDV